MGGVIACAKIWLKIREIKLGPEFTASHQRRRFVHYALSVCTSTQGKDIKSTVVYDNVCFKKASFSTSLAKSCGNKCLQVVLCSKVG